MTSGADALNAAQGGLQDVDCPICRNRGYILLPGETLVCRECECMAKRRTLKRMRRSGLCDLLDAYTFARYETPEPWQRDALSKARAFLDGGEGKWFFISGTPGTGKTHLCTAIAGQLIAAGREVRYMLWREEAPRLKALVNDREAYEKLMGEFRRVPVLYIDDFFKGGVTEGDVNLAFELLNGRYIRRNAITLISSEKDAGTLLDIDEAIGSRIYERSRGFCIKTPAQNWRLR
ncbi:MAG: ATP-binding protein [Oscillospiraceae bacterium]